MSRQPAIPLLGVLEAHRIARFPTKGLNQPLHLVVGPGRVGPCSIVSESHGVEILGNLAGDAAWPDLSHCPAGFVAIWFRVAVAMDLYSDDCTAQKANHRYLLITCQPLAVRKPGGVEANADLVVASAVGVTLLAISVDAVATFRNLARDLTSMWIRLPGRLYSYRSSGGLGSRIRNRLGTGWLMARATV